MGEPPTRPWADIVLALLVVGFATAIYWQTLSLPPPRYEPLGPAALPQALAVMLVVFALIIMARGLRGLRAGAGRVPEEPAEFQPRAGRAAVAYGVTAAFVATMDLRVAGFVGASLVFVVVLVLVLSRPSWRELPWIMGFAIVLSLGSYLVFTQWFYIDLP